jgi:hypothetical protein
MRPGSRAALRSTFALAVLVALVVTGPLAATAAGLSTGAGTADTGAERTSVGSTALQADNLTRDGTTMTVRLQADGDAQWRISTEFQLNDSADRAAFDDLAGRFERGDADVGFDIGTFQQARSASNETVNRTMRLRRVDRRTRVVNGTDGTATGRLILQFTWTRFATVGNETYRFGDAFRTEGGTWLPGLTTGQRLVVRAPPGFGVDTAPVAPRDGLLQWEGPREFDPGYLTATYRQVGPVSPTPPTITTSPTTSVGPTSPTSVRNATTDPPENDQTLLLLGGLGVIIALALVIVLLARRRADDLPGFGGSGAPTGTDGGTGAAAAEPGGEPDEPDEPDEESAAANAELLSDEERVERLLEENGGRMKQGNIVSETGWSNAKVSQLLSAMDEDERVDKLRIGRENLISLPDQDVTDIERDEE